MAALKPVSGESRFMSSAPFVSQDVSELARTFAGQLLQPSDSGYEEARRVHNGLVDKRPALIARCRGSADIADAVKLAQTLNLEVAVRGAATMWRAAQLSTAG